MEQVIPVDQPPHGKKNSPITKKFSDRNGKNKLDFKWVLGSIGSVTMNHVMRLASDFFGVIQTLTPFQLLSAAVCTILLGYLGIVTRSART
jgi:hypothetical protein